MRFALQHVTSYPTKTKLLLEVNLWDCDEYRWGEIKSNHSCFTMVEKVVCLFFNIFFLQITLCKHSSLHKKTSLLLSLDIMTAWVWSQRLASGYGFASALCLLFACKFKSYHKQETEPSQQYNKEKNFVSHKWVQVKVTICVTFSLHLLSSWSWPFLFVRV